MFKATREASIYQRKLNREKVAWFLQELKKKGMIIDEHPDIDSFKKKVEPLKAQFSGPAKKYLDMILEATK